MSKANNYELGGHCKQGHLLTTENTYRRRNPNYLVCKTCKAITDRAYRLKNQERIQARQLEWTRKNPDKKRRTSRKNALMRKYGITLEQFDSLWDAQGGLCAICKTAGIKLANNGNNHWLSLYVDHCHTTNEVRGLLCWNCNVAIGHFRDSQERLSAASAYLAADRPFADESKNLVG